jgi:hypothetical protein
MTCVTPSNPDSIPFGESLDIEGCLAATNGGSLLAAGTDNPVETGPTPVDRLPRATVLGEPHRVDNLAFLYAQTLKDSREITELWNRSRVEGVQARSRSSQNNLRHPDIDPSTFGPPRDSFPSPPPPTEETREEELADDLIPDEIEDAMYDTTRAATFRSTI